MRRCISINCVIMLTLFSGCAHVSSSMPQGPVASKRATVDLSGTGWSLWRDSSANWMDDELFLPPVNLLKIPNNSPTGGWDVLERHAGMAVSVPGTAEEYLGDGTGPTTSVKGVTWWTRSLPIPAGARGKKIRLQFDSVRMRAEVYVNRKLVGYDLIGNTPFEADITDTVRPGETARLAVRITNPGGNFDWRDIDPDHWGKQQIPLGHGFGGISGDVRMVVTDPVYIDDVYVQNQPEVTTVKVFATVKNTTSNTVVRDVEFNVEQYSGVVNSVSLPPGQTVVERTISLPDAKVWDMQHPNLYTCSVNLEVDHALRDSQPQTFGFRWFNADGIGSDAMLRLNNKRVVLRTAISWGFWPINGLFPSAELAEKQIKDAQAFGMNMLNFHRGIGNPIVMRKADELGLLYFEEPGGYVSAAGNKFAQAICREKLLRMVKRDRSHPSVVIYNMINEQWDKWINADPSITPVHRADLEAAHAIDPSRILLYTSAWAKKADDDLPAKMHMRPFDDTVHYNGWNDSHRAGGPFVWNQSFYKGPADHYGNTTNQKEIVYWGEEGAVSTPPRLGLIKQTLDASPRLGWDGKLYLDWYSAFDHFIDVKNLRGIFPKVDDLCQAMGVVGLEHQGRKIEDTRVANLNDGYAINGWEAEIIENHSGIVDCFRNPKADPGIIARYNKPLCVAVKPRQQIARTGSEVTVDFYVLNEIDLRGPHTLEITATSPDGKQAFTQRTPVELKGGDVFSQLAAEAVAMNVSTAPGMFSIAAKLLDSGGVEKASGHDELLLVDWKSDKLAGSGAVYENDGKVAGFLKNEKGLAAPAYTDASPRLDWVVVARGVVMDTVPIPANCLSAADGTAGLQATFFKNTDLTQKVYERRDKTIDFHWGGGSNPDSNVPLTEGYSVRWEGQITPRTTGDYTINTYATDGIRLWIDGKQLLDKWTGGAHKDKIKIPLEAGKALPLKLEYYHDQKTAEIHLLWTPPELNHIDPAALLNRARIDGTTLIFLDKTPAWTDALKQFGGVKIKANFKLGNVWLGGQYFVKSHPLFNGLPTNVAMNWPYQAVVDGARMAFEMDGEELIVGGYQTWPMHIGTAVGIVPLDKGKLILSNLNIADKLDDKDSAAEVARKLLCNYVEYAR